MNEFRLEFEIKRKDLTPGGDIPHTCRGRIQKFLNKGGFIICPSDTSYSIAASCSPHATEIGTLLNEILERKDMPFSVAVDSVGMAAKYLEDNNKVLIKLLETFTPGPITCIGYIRKNMKYLSEIIHSEKDDTIGIRIPGNIIEKNIARLATYPITTVPTCIGGSSQVIDYSDAKKNIVESINKKGLSEKIKLAAIESDEVFTSDLSTVVRVENVLKQIHIIRLGAISEVELKLFLFDNKINGWEVLSDEI
jgi:tRNA A37 threonylcarbamoyladenosine synthetase subunit TsaC/SUA5/YrdC